jgi:large subunit ribosomal protein L23
MESIFNVIQKIVVTNKSTNAELRGVYTCVIDPRATKIDVKKTFETLYGVKVEKVNIIKTREKFHNTRKGVAMKRSPMTKAMVTLAGNDRIVDFQKVQ